LYVLKDKNRVKDGFELFDRILEFLDLGRKEWPNQPREYRGSIFEASWRAGVQKLYVQLLLMVYLGAQTRGEDSFHLLEKAKRISDRMRKENNGVQDELGVTSHDYVFAFVAYSSAWANRATGLYYMESAKRKHFSQDGLSEESAAAVKSLLKRAAPHFGHAASKYMPDDEWRCECLMYQLRCLFLIGTTARIILSVLDELEKAIDAVRTVWGSNDSTPFWEWEAMMKYARKLRRDIMDGSCTMNSHVKPERFQLWLYV